MTKQCNRCGYVGPLEDFNRNHLMKDGRLNQCKQCTRRKNRDWNRRHPEKVARFHRDMEAAKRRNREWREENREKDRAHKAVYKALKAGKLVRPDACERCGRKGRVHGHHDDYMKRLEVRWLCTFCHRAEHPIEGPPLAGEVLERG